MPYEIKQQGDAKLFSVSPDPLPQPPPVMSRKMAIILAVVFFVMLFLAFPISLFIGGFAAYKWYVNRQFHKALRRAEEMPYRRDYQFLVSPEGLSIDGALIPRSEIHRIRTLWRAGDEAPASTVRVVDTETVHGRAREKAYQSLMTYYFALAPFTYRIQVEAGGKAIFVAGGVDQIVAAAVKTEIERALGGA